MVQLVDGEDGRVKIECPTQGQPIEGAAQAEHVRVALTNWSARLEEYKRRTG